MPSSKTYLLPPPKSLRQLAGTCILPNRVPLFFDHKIRLTAWDSIESFARQAEASGAFRMELTSGRPEAGGIHASLDAAKLSRDAYKLEIKPDGVRLQASAAPGLHNGLQTLLQILRQHGVALPCMKIDDDPQFATRGFYHDCTRGKVPRLETLFALAEKMAHYKLNHLQLYVEHTYAFRGHPDIWQGSDPLTAEDIVKLDDHCARLHIDLVPSLSTFGHFYTALRSPRKEHLNEMDIHASEKAFSWPDRMAHYTLDCLNPESLEIVRELIHETIPLFRSRLFNICCDETFDLGKGRNAAAAKSIGEGKLYVDFLKKIMKVVYDADRTPMYWGDIIGHHPELVKELPRDAIALDWNYDFDMSKHGRSALFRKHRIPFYVCPGVHGWQRWSAHVERAHSNIVSFAKIGLREGATGFLNTDWGDFGHVAPLAIAWHGMVLGAAASWNCNDAVVQTKHYDETFSRLECGDPLGKTADTLRQISKAEDDLWNIWDMLVRWVEESSDEALKDRLKKFPATRLRNSLQKIETARVALAAAAMRSNPRDPLFFREVIAAAWGSSLMIRIALEIIDKSATGAKKIASLRAVSNDLRRFEAEMTQVWHLRNLPSEYFHVRATLMEMALRLDRRAQELKR